ncbi:reactive intermediate/imine deaminase [Clostridium sp. chh4-2]|uniref:RidA family protein n=1 Tax=Clostridium sp. chh4-2 TaxID=2067550 RepID=UPI000CCF318A|nr:RidA family protein [Clostridium sp. chh4-2]PNV61629.1 reactive intermediate/imine deaminase [Clostridium sp. chh4-2]
MSKIVTNNAPAAIGPYSQGVTAGKFVFVSGQLPIDPETGSFPEGDIKVLTARSLKNIEAILKEAGGSLENVVKTSIFVTDLKQFADVNEAYSKFFGDVPPARSCVEVAALPKGAAVEIEAIAYI